MAKNNKDDTFRDIIINSTKPLESIQPFENSYPITLLSEEIQNGKKSLKYNAVEFIIGKLLNKNGHIIDYRRKGFINFFVIGSFKNEFMPVTKVAEAFASFYLEMQVMPNIIPISQEEFLTNEAFSLSKIKNGVLIYDRERNLHRYS